jgi:hypothetical protein
MPTKCGRISNLLAQTRKEIPGCSYALCELDGRDRLRAAEAADGQRGGGKISVWRIASVGAEASVSSRDTTANRIKFEVPISLPVADG